MPKLLLAGLAVLLLAADAPAQPLPPPTAYSAEMLVTFKNSQVIFGMKIYRDGAKMMVEQFRDTPDPIEAWLPTVPPSRSRVYYNLDTHKWFSTDPDTNPSTVPGRPVTVSPNCRTGTFRNFWDDPFDRSAQLMEEFNRQNPIETGTTALNGFSTRILVSRTGATKMKIWLDTKYGLIVKAESQGRLLFELKKLTVEQPKASLLIDPPYCAFAVPTP